MKFKKLNVPMKDVPFLGLLSLFVIFAAYGVFSFSSTFSGYANKMQTSVLSADEKMVVLDTATSEATSVLDEKIFTDVNTSHPNATAIAYFKQMGFIAGYDDGSFNPDGQVNRAELLTVLAKVLDIDMTGGVYENCFSDVKTEWFATFVCYAKDKSWVAGYKNGTYKPGQVVNKAEALKISFNAFGFQVPAVTEKPFVDVEVGEWYASTAKFAKDGNIVTGDTFAAGTPMTRALYVQAIYDILVFSGSVAF